MPDTDINAGEVRLFLQNKHELAYCYLLTVGAKALVLSSEENISTDVLRTGVHNESLIRQRITLDEVSNIQQSRLRDGIGIEVYKRSRNHTSKRKVWIKIKQIKSTLLESGGEYLVWDSSWTNRRVKFSLATLISAEIISGPILSPTTHHGSHHHSSMFTEKNVDHYVKLTNKERSVEFLFPTMIESESFLFYCSSLIRT